MFEILKRLLSDYYILYLKTQNYHWNFEGRDFFIWHKQFEEQYKDLAEAIDTVAELIRGIGQKTPAKFETYSQYSSIQPGNENYTSQEMIDDITAGHQAIMQTLEEALESVQKAGDEVVADFIIGRMVHHRKVLWMLNSSKDKR